MIKHISENPYLQYFIGMKEYSSECPFGASTMVAFRKWFSPEDIAQILEATIPESEQESDNGGDDDQYSPNSGTLILDATCCLADKLYRNRQTLAYCKERKIRLTGPALEKTPKDRALSKQTKAREYQDSCDRNEVEGVFGTGKTAYGLGSIVAHLEATTFCTIGVALILMNLTKRLRSLLRLFYAWLLWGNYQPILAVS